MRRIPYIVVPLFFAGAITVLLIQERQVEPESPGTLQQSPPPPHSWWVEFEEEYGSTGCPCAVSKSLAWLLLHHNDDGTWGNGSTGLEGRTLGKTGLTALALLPLLGGGYTPMSKDVFLHEGGEWCFGREISKALDWIRRDQREDGSFRSVGDESFDQILAACALSEVYGLTAQASFRKSAQTAVDAMIRMQKPDGSWEGDEPTAWAILALYSAKQSELSLDPAVIDRTLRCSSVPGHPGGALARILSKNHPADAAWSLQEESRDRDPRDLAWWYLATLAMWAHDGARSVRTHMEDPGQQWQTWSPAMKEALVPLIRRDGSVEGKSLSDTIARTSLLQLTLEVYYRYTCVLAPR
jgi:hypothetical protein